MLGPVGSPVDNAPGDNEAEDDPAAFLPSPHGLLPGGLSLRLTMRARPLALLRRLLLAAACAATGFLLLAAVSHAAGAPEHPSTALVRLAWCAVPLAAVAQLAVAVSRTETETTPGLAAVGLGPSRLPLLAAAQTVLTCVLGSAAALVAFLRLRDHLAGTAPLPAAGVATLLAVVPLVASAACVIALRPGRHVTGAVAGPVWGIAATAVGLAAELYARSPARHPHGTIPLPGGLGSIAPVVLTGWALVVAGPALAGPGLVHLTGRLLSAYHPGALRLLAGRALQADAGRIGRPLGVLSTAVCTVASAYAIRDAASRPLGPLTLLASAVVLLCPAVALAAAMSHARHDRNGTAITLTTLGAAQSLLRSSTLLRTAVLLTVLIPVTATLTWLAIPVTLRG